MKRFPASSPAPKTRSPRALRDGTFWTRTSSLGQKHRDVTDAAHDGKAQKALMQTLTSKERRSPRSIAMADEPMTLLSKEIDSQAQEIALPGVKLASRSRSFALRSLAQATQTITPEESRREELTELNEKVENVHAGHGDTALHRSPSRAMSITPSINSVASSHKSHHHALLKPSASTNDASSPIPPLLTADHPYGLSPLTAPGGSQPAVPERNTSSMIKSVKPEHLIVEPTEHHVLELEKIITQFGLIGGSEAHKGDKDRGIHVEQATGNQHADFVPATPASAQEPVVSDSAAINPANKSTKERASKHAPVIVDIQRSTESLDLSKTASGLSSSGGKSITPVLASGTATAVPATGMRSRPIKQAGEGRHNSWIRQLLHRSSYNDVPAPSASRLTARPARESRLVTSSSMRPDALVSTNTKNLGPPEAAEREGNPEKSSETLTKAISNIEGLLDEALLVATQAAGADRVTRLSTHKEAISSYEGDVVKLRVSKMESLTDRSDVTADRVRNRAYSVAQSGVPASSTKSSSGHIWPKAPEEGRRGSTVSTLTTARYEPAVEECDDSRDGIGPIETGLKRERTWSSGRYGAANRTPYPAASLGVSKGQSVASASAGHGHPSDTSLSASDSDESMADVEDNTEARPHTDLARVEQDHTEVYTLQDLIPVDQRLPVGSEGLSTSNPPTPARFYAGPRRVDWAVRRPSSDRLSEVGRKYFQISRKPTAIQSSDNDHESLLGSEVSRAPRLVKQSTFKGYTDGSASQQGTSQNRPASRVGAHTREPSMINLSELPAATQAKAGESPAVNDTVPSGSKISLHDRHHVSFRSGRRLSFRRLHRRQPIARDWSLPRKRFVASVVCINTAFLGLIVGIYVSMQL